MIRRPPRSTRVRSSAASDVYKRQVLPSQPSPTQPSARISPSFSAFLAFTASVQSFSICLSSSAAALPEAAGFFASTALFWACASGVPAQSAIINSVPIGSFIESSFLVSVDRDFLFPPPRCNVVYTSVPLLDLVECKFIFCLKDQVPLLGSRREV